MDRFSLDQRLEQDTIFIRELELSRLLLMNDNRYPWFILVPRKEGVTELFELSYIEQKLLMSEITEISKIIKSNFKSEKINVAALGNIVSQLHIHIVARFKSDMAWPDPIWGKGEVIKYDFDTIEDIKRKFRL